MSQMKPMSRRQNRNIAASASRNSGVTSTSRSTGFLPRTAPIFEQLTLADLAGNGCGNVERPAGWTESRPQPLMNRLRRDRDTARQLRLAPGDMHCSLDRRHDAAIKAQLYWRFKPNLWLACSNGRRISSHA